MFVYSLNSEDGYTSRISINNPTCNFSSTNLCTLYMQHYNMICFLSE